MTHLITAVTIAAGTIAGAVTGDIVGLALRSDNLPFFVALGAIVGLAAGLVTALVASRQPTGGRR
jgi:hypothetical protein